MATHGSEELINWGDRRDASPEEASCENRRRAPGREWALGLVCFAFFGSAGLAASHPKAPPPDARYLTDVKFVGDDDSGATEILLQTDGLPPTPVVFTLKNPERLVIDLPQLGSRLSEPVIPVASPFARTVRVGRHRDFTRVVVDAGGAEKPFSRWRLEDGPSGLRVLLGVEGSPARQAIRELPAVSAGPDAGDGAESAPSAPPETDITRVYGLDLETEGDRDRLLIFAESGLQPVVDTSEKGRAVIDLPGARLDPSAPARLSPEVGRGVSLVIVFEQADAKVPTVRLVIDYVGETLPEVSRRGAILALDFLHSAETRAGLTLEFRDAPLADVIRAIAEATGESFTHDRLEGRVTISGGGRVHPEEAMELLHSALLLRGYAAVRGPSGIHKVMRIEGGQAGGAWTANDQLGGVAPMTTLVQLRHASPAAVVDAMRGWLGQRVIALPYPRTNSIILSGSGERLGRLLQAIRALDESSESEFVMKRLHHRGAEEAVALLQESFETKPGEEMTLLSDPRTNTVLIRANRARVPSLRSFLDRLDIPVEGGGEIHVLRLQAADPEELAARLLELRQPPETTDNGALSPFAGRDFHITADPPSRSLLIRSDPVTFRDLAEVVSELDRIPQRIRLELLVLEINSTGTLSLGFDAFTPLSRPSDQNDVISTLLINPSGGGLINPGSAAAPNGVLRFTRAPLIVPILNAGGVPISVQIPRESFVISADAATLESRILMRPNLLMVAGEEHELFAGANVPVPNQQDGSADALNNLQTRVDIERQDVGLRLRVTPTVGVQGSVKLDLFIEDTQVIDAIAGGGSSQGVSLTQRRVETSVILHDGEYAVVGLSKERVKSTNESGTPYLKDIPLIGYLTKATDDSDIERQFVVAVRARLLRNNLEVAADSIRERIGFERSLARADGLGTTSGSDPIFAVRVRTLADPVEAERFAGSLRGPDGAGRIVSWKWEGEARYDVVLTGYRDLSHAASAVVSLEDAGWYPSVLPLREVPPAKADSAP